MIKIGILGDIGSGKSFVSKQFGFPVFSADEEVKKIYREDRECFRKLRKKLPKFINFFPIHKTNLIRAVLANPKNLGLINQIVHPKVKKRLHKFFLKNIKNKVVILDVPLLLENKINIKNYILIFIDAKKTDINKNLIKRKNFNSKLIRKLRKIQLPLKTKKKASNYIIKNNFSSEQIRKKIKIIKKEILSL